MYAPRTPDLLREAEFAMLWPSNFRWKTEHDDDNNAVLEPPRSCSQSAGNHNKSLRPAPYGLLPTRHPSKEKHQRSSVP